MMTHDFFFFSVAVIVELKMAADAVNRAASALL